MASMLDVRPGVMVKGFRELERDPALYSMDDVEDDGQVCGKKSHKTLFVYFFLNVLNLLYFILKSFERFHESLYFGDFFC